MPYKIMNKGGHYGCYAAVKRVAKAAARKSGQPQMILWTGPRKQKPWHHRDVRFVNHYIWGNGQVDAFRKDGKYYDHPKSKR